MREIRLRYIGPMYFLHWLSSKGYLRFPDDSDWSHMDGILKGLDSCVLRQTGDESNYSLNQCSLSMASCGPCLVTYLKVVEQRIKDVS